MTDKTQTPAAGETGKDAAASEPRVKARIVLPKPPPRGGGAGAAAGKGGPGFARGGAAHSQTNQNKPPRLPGRNG